MTQKDIIEMADKCGLLVTQHLVAFAKLVDAKATAKEREACAKMFDDRDTGTGFYEPHEPAEMIRARSGATLRGEA